MKIRSHDEAMANPEFASGYDAAVRLADGLNMRVITIVDSNETIMVHAVNPTSRASLSIE